MSEDRAPYTASSNNDMADFQAAVERQQLYLEIEKIHVLPDDYWPSEWRKTLRHLVILMEALTATMADQTKAMAHSKRIADACGLLATAIEDLESELYNPDRTKRPSAWRK